MAKKQKTTAILGRKTQYRKVLDDVVFKLCLLKAIDSEIAEVLCITESTFNLWKEKHATFSESIKKGKAEADANVAERLYERAMGYSHPEDKIFCNQVATRVEKGIGEDRVVTTSMKQVITRVPTIKHYPPDFSSMCFWLKNRAGWKDIQDYSLNVKVYSPEECDSIRKRLASRMIESKVIDVEPQGIH